MTDHFAYLFEDNESDFFQKIACDLADKGTPSAAEPIVKIAASQSPEVNTIEKVAARLEQDIFILKTAGESGLNLGAIQRSLGYIDNLVDNVAMEPEQSAELFDKVAAATIEHDLVVVRDELYKLADEEYRPWVDAQIAAVGVELVKAAELDKEALIGVVRALKGIRSAWRGTKGLGAATRLKAVGGAPRQAWRARRAEVAVARKGKAAQRLRQTQRKLQQVRAAGIAKSRAAQKITDPALRSRVAPGVAAKTKGRVEKQSLKVEKAGAKLRERSGIAKQKKSVVVGTTTPAAAKQQIKATKQKAKADAGVAAKKAKSATTPPKTPPPKTETPAGALADKAGAGEATLKGAFGKWRDGGWSKLSPAEKQKLINAGLAGAVGHRVLLGKGVVTGGEGIV